MQLTDAQWARIEPLMPIPRGNCEMHALSAPIGWQLVTPPKSNRRQPWMLNRKAYRRVMRSNVTSDASKPCVASTADTTSSLTSTSTKSSSPTYTS